jgi:hypothetical protein
VTFPLIVPPAYDVRGAAINATAATPNMADNALFIGLPPCD